MAGDRSKLTSRILPEMVLSSGSPTSLTAPPPPLSATIPPAARAAARFAVHGNAIVTGGAGDLGSAMCRALLEHGASGVMILDLSAAQAQQPVVDRLRAEFPEARVDFAVTDVTDAEAVTRGVARARDVLGTIDVVLCFAGIASTIHAAEMTPADFSKIVDINATGAFLCAQAAGRVMIEQGTGGSIVLVASISAHRVNFPQPQVHYNAAKAAVLGIKSSLAAEWARYGIRVNSVSPGYMNTILNEGAGLESCRRLWASRCPMGRMGEPDELAGAVVLLASRAGSYITGTDIVVDGGQTLF